MLAEIHHKAKDLSEARAQAARVLDIYERALYRYPDSAVFNATDVRLLVHSIEDLLAYTRSRRKAS